MRVLTIAVLLAACGNSPGAGSDGGGGDDAPPGDGTGGDGDVDPDAPVISTCIAGTWCREDAPAGVTGFIHAVDVVEANDVFAAGDGGVILRRQNGAWAKMTSNTTEDLHALWARTGDDVWAAGENSTVVHWNGTEWSVVTGAPANIDFAGVWGSAADDVWFVGTGRAIHWGGSSLTNPGSVITGSPVSIAGTAANDIWVAAENGKLSHFTTSWTFCTGATACAVPTGLGNNFYAVAARTSSDVWASNSTAGTIRWNGSTWSQHAAGVLFASLYAPAADNAWGVGSTSVGHWDGAGWTVAPPIAGFASALYGVSGVGPHTWIVGADGSILYHHD